MADQCLHEPSSPSQISGSFYTEEGCCVAGCCRLGDHASQGGEWANGGWTAAPRATATLTAPATPRTRPAPDATAAKASAWCVSPACCGPGNGSLLLLLPISSHRSYKTVYLVTCFKSPSHHFYQRLSHTLGNARTIFFFFLMERSHSFFFFPLNLFIYFWLRWVFVSVRGLSLVAASGGHSSLWCAGFSLSRPLLLRSTGSRCAGSVIAAHGPSCSAACGIFPDQGSNPCALHWQADSQPLRHQGSPRNNLVK